MILFLLACGATEKDSDADLEIAEEVKTDIEDFETNYLQPAGWEGVVVSEDGTHGDYVSIWADELAMTAIAEGTEFPDGATIVKCGYADESGEGDCALTAMRKIEGYDSDNGDWFWISFDGDGEVNNYGSVSGCVSCHSVDSNGDYVRITE